MTRPTRRPQTIQPQPQVPPESNGADHRPASAPIEPPQEQQPSRYNGWGFLLILWAVAFGLLVIWELWGFIARLF